jgi:hypothetical protein
LPRRLGHQGSLQIPWSPYPDFHLGASPWKMGGLHVLRTWSSTLLHTPSRRVEDLLASLQDSKGSAYRDKVWFTLEPAHKAATLYSLTLSRANLALTFLWNVLRSKDVIKWHSSGLEVSSRVCVTSLESSNLKWPGMRRIYRQ